jgi:cytochrome c oxidase assembly protein subunit 15
MAVAGLVLVQAVLGGLIVAHGTNTHFLFLHQGNAALTMACLLIALVRVVDGSRPAAAVLAPRRGIILAAAACMVLVWGEIVIGALVAGSRNGGAFNVHPIDGGALLWRYDQSLVWNLLDNAQFHQWLHRVTGWLLAAALAALFLLGWTRRAVIGQRAKLVLMVGATFLPVQLILGLSNVEVGIVPALSLAHQTMGMCLFLSMVLVWHDLRCEGRPFSVTSSQPALAGGVV